MAPSLEKVAGSPWPGLALCRDWYRVTPFHRGHGFWGSCEWPLTVPGPSVHSTEAGVRWAGPRLPLLLPVETFVLMSQRRLAALGLSAPTRAPCRFSSAPIITSARFCCVFINFIKPVNAWENFLGGRFAPPCIFIYWKQNHPSKLCSMLTADGSGSVRFGCPSS